MEDEESDSTLRFPLRVRTQTTTKDPKDKQGPGWHQVKSCNGLLQARFTHILARRLARSQLSRLASRLAPPIGQDVLRVWLCAPIDMLPRPALSVEYLGGMTAARWRIGVRLHNATTCFKSSGHVNPPTCPDIKIRHLYGPSGLDYTRSGSAFQDNLVHRQTLVGPKLYS